MPVFILRNLSIDWHVFLERQRLPTPAADTLVPLRDSAILITGAAGSIGSALSLRLAALVPRSLILLDTCEQALHRLQANFKDANSPIEPHFVLGNLSDAMLVRELIKRYSPSIVFHAAAYKHLPLLEEHPIEAIANNSLATLTLVESAADTTVRRIVLLSTDKAASPCSILGATKQLAERIVLAHGGVALRLANVLGTEGSVSETFLKQLAEARPLTVTTPEAKRYFVTCDEAVDLLLGAALSNYSGVLLAPQLSRLYLISDLARFLMAGSLGASTASIVYTGDRIGDKESEVFWSGNEEFLYADSITGLEIRRGASDLPALGEYMPQLRKAVHKRNAASALAWMLHLVPGYRPSHSILLRAQNGANEDASR